MTLSICRFSLPPPISSSNSHPPTIFLSFKPISAYKPRKEVPATDRIIDFGKYKGRMLGTLPSKYLRWISKNLRSRDFDDWAKLADQVLQDPVYKDRLEWEVAEQVLTGDNPRASRTQNASSDLLEISQRFGWDYENKAAWSRIDFGLIGTSRGGQIPRISDDRNSALSDKRGFGVSKTEDLGSSARALKLPKGREAEILPVGTRGLRLEEMSSLEKGLGLQRERETGYSSGVPMDSPIEESTAGSENRDKLGLLSRNSSFPRAEEADSSDATSKSWKIGRVGFFREHSTASKAKTPNLSVRKKVGVLSKGVRFYNVDEEEYLQEDIVEGRREERRGIRRVKRMLQMQRLKKEVGVQEEQEKENTTENQNRQRKLNPFPGRESLLRKANRLTE